MAWGLEEGGKTTEWLLYPYGQLTKKEGEISSSLAPSATAGLVTSPVLEPPLFALYHGRDRLLPNGKIQGGFLQELRLLPGF